MKKWIIPLLMVLVAFSVTAAPLPDIIEINVTDTITNTASATADTGVSTGKFSGWFDYLVIDLTGHTSPNIDIDIIATGQMGSRTLFEINDITTDGIYPVRDLATTQLGVDIAATPARIPIIGDLITVTAFDSDSITGVNVNVFLVLSPVP